MRSLVLAASALSAIALEAQSQNQLLAGIWIDTATVHFIIAPNVQSLADESRFRIKIEVELLKAGLAVRRYEDQVAREAVLLFVLEATPVTEAKDSYVWNADLELLAHWYNPGWFFRNHSDVSIDAIDAIGASTLLAEIIISATASSSISVWKDGMFGLAPSRYLEEQAYSALSASITKFLVRYLEANERN